MKTKKLLKTIFSKHDIWLYLGLLLLLIGVKVISGASIPLYTGYLPYYGYQIGGYDESLATNSYIANAGVNTPDTALWEKMCVKYGFDCIEDRPW